MKEGDSSPCPQPEGRDMLYGAVESGDKENGYLDFLPEDLVLLIFGYLDGESLLCLSGACRSLRELVMGSDNWEHLAIGYCRQVTSEQDKCSHIRKPAGEMSPKQWFSAWQKHHRDWIFWAEPLRTIKTNTPTAQHAHSCPESVLLLGDRRVSTKNRTYAVGFRDGSIITDTSGYRSAADRHHARWSAHQGSVHHLVPVGTDCFASGGMDGVVAVWNARGAKLCDSNVHAGKSRVMALRSDRSLSSHDTFSSIFSGFSDGSVALMSYDPLTKTDGQMKVTTCRAHSQRVSSVDACSGVFASTCYDGTVAVFTCRPTDRSRNLGLKYSGGYKHGDPCLSASIRMGGAQLASASKTVAIFDVTTGQKIYEYSRGHHRFPARFLHFSGSTAHTVGNDTRVKCWDQRIPDGPVFSVGSDQETARSVDFSDNGWKVVIGCGSGNLKIFDTRRRKFVSTTMDILRLSEVHSISCDQDRVLTASGHLCLLLSYI